MSDGTLRFDTSLDTTEFQKGGGKIGDIFGGMSVFKIVEKGFQAITASIDEAVQRYDTFNAFPRVLDNMGFSSEQAEASMSALAASVEQLPTPLNDMVATAQKLTVLTGDLDGATATTIALNNAFLASGSSAADASRGLVQYSQMLSSGKVDMQSWKVLQETMGYALQKTAEGFGFAGASAQRDLYAALQDGTVTFDEFNAKIIELNEGMGGFEEVALKTCSGIGTAMANMKQMTAAGVQEIIAALDRGFSQTRFGSIENIIKSASAGINAALNSVAGAFEFVAKNSETLIPITLTLAGAFGAYSVVNTVTKAFSAFNTAALAAQGISAASKGLIITEAGARSALTAALASNSTAEAVRAAAKTAGMTIDSAGNLITAAGTTATVAETTALLGSCSAISAKAIVAAMLTGKIGIVTGAQWLWNAAMAANPIGLIIAGIAALIVGIIALISWLSASSAEYKKNKEEVKALGEAQEQTAQDISDSAAAFEKSSAEITANAKVTRDLVGALKDAGSASKDAENYHEDMERAVDNLSDAVDGLNLSYDKETGVIRDLNSMQEVSLDKIEALVDAKSQLAQASAWQDRENELKAEYNRLVMEQTIVEDKIADIRANDNLTQREKNKLIKDLEDTSAEYTTQILNAETEMQIAKDRTAEIDTRAAKNIINNYEAVNGARDKDGKNLKQLALQYGVSTDQILAEMEEAGESISEWSDRNARNYTKDGQSIQGLANQYDMSVEEIEQCMDDWGMSLDEFSEHMAGTLTKDGENIEQLAVRWGKTADEIRTEMDNMGIDMDEWNDRQQEAWDSFESTVKDKSSGVINGFKEIPEKFDQSAKDMLQILKDNKTRYAEWEEAMEAITRELGPTAAEEFAKLGPEATSAMQEILGSADLLEEYRDVFGVKIDETTGLAVENWNDPNFIGAPSGAIDTSAQQVSANPALENAVVEQMQVAISAAESVDFSAVGSNITEQIVAGLNSAAVVSGMNAINSAVQTGSTNVQTKFRTLSTNVQTLLNTLKTQSTNIVTQMMTSINTTITTRAATVRASVTTMSNGVTTTLNTLKTQSTNIVTQMMTGINSAVVTKSATVKSSVTSMCNAIVSTLNGMKTQAESAATQMMGAINSAIITGTATVKASAEAAANGILDKFNGLKESLKTVMENAMAGMLKAMTDNAQSLYDKADEIARNIAKKLADALEVRSPSRVTYGIFDNVMLGIWKAMDDASAWLYRKAEDIADTISERLHIEPDVFGDVFDKLQDLTGMNVLGGNVPMLQVAGAGISGGINYNTSLTQHITSPKPLSPSEMTREAQDMLRRQKHQLK